jgi:hypothetical protein
MDFRTFARSVLGRQPGMVVGRDVSAEEFEADKKAYDYYVKKGIDQVMTVQQPPPEVTGGSFTNAEGRVTDYIVKPKGVEVQLLEPKVLTTPGGTYTMKSPTNAVPVLLPDGSTAQNYTGDPTMGAPAPTIGGGMAVTNAPTAAPSPAPQQLREGSVVRQNGVTYRITNGVPVPVTGP